MKYYKLLITHKESLSLKEKQAELIKAALLSSQRPDFLLVGEELINTKYIVGIIRDDERESGQNYLESLEERSQAFKRMLLKSPRPGRKC